MGLGEGVTTKRPQALERLFSDLSRDSLCLRPTDETISQCIDALCRVLRPQRPPQHFTLPGSEPC
jgi:hypothetical protein